MDIKKMVEYISKNGSTEKSQGENKDCAVRAVSAAFDVSYDEAHDFAQLQWSRKRGRGTNTNSIIKTMDKISDPKVNLFGKNTKSMPVLNEYTFKKGNIRGSIKCKSKLSTFANKNRKGTYFVLVDQNEPGKFSFGPLTIEINRKEDRSESLIKMQGIEKLLSEDSFLFTGCKYEK